MDNNVRLFQRPIKFQIFNFALLGKCSELRVKGLRFFIAMVPDSDELVTKMEVENFGTSLRRGAISRGNTFDFVFLRFVSELRAVNTKNVQRGLFSLFHFDWRERRAGACLK